MNPTMTPCAAPPGFYGGPYLPSHIPYGYPTPCVPDPGSYPVPFPGYGGPFPQPFFGPPQPYPSIPYAYGPCPGMFPPGYMVPQQQYPQPCMYGGPPMPPPPLAHSQNGVAEQCPVMPTNEIPNNIRDQEQRTGSALMKPGDASSCESVLPAPVYHQQQQISTVPRKSPPGFPQIPSGDISPASIQWNTMVSNGDLQVPGIPNTDIQDKDDSETDGSESELWLQSSEYSTASCQTTPDTNDTSDCQQQLPDLTADTQPPRSDALPEHSNDKVVNAQTIDYLQEPSYQELVTEQEETATSSLLDPQQKEISEALNADSTLSVPAIAVYVTITTTESDTTDGQTRSTWNAANKDLPLNNYRELLVCVFHFVDHGLGIPSGLPLENKCWVVPWPITLT
ncbi:RNA-binding protein 27-like [Saccostrea cucullata]|uniref:RNA-binding protein 27-like n=1 Tax=Saccostrea cuccullata TaxID=36930 RepID=UPI002ED25DB6